MGTRSTIIQRLDNGKYRSINCKFDGFYSHVGYILLNNYNNYEKLSKLLELGMLHSLEEEVDIPEGVIHSYDNRQVNITIALVRDCDYKDWKSVCPETKDTLSDSLDESYSYLFFENNWYVEKENLVEIINDLEDCTLLFNLIKNTITIEDIELVLLSDLKDYIKDLD